MVGANVVATEGYELVQHGEGVSHPSIGAFGNCPSSFFFDRDSFLSTDGHEVLCNDVSRNRAKVKALTTRDNGREDFMRLRGGKDEFYMRRRFFQSLEQGIKRR